MHQDSPRSNFLASWHPQWDRGAKGWLPCHTHRPQATQQQLQCSVTGRSSADIIAAVKLNIQIHKGPSQHGLARLTWRSGTHSTVTSTPEQQNPSGKNVLYPRSLPRGPLRSLPQVTEQLQSQEFYLTIQERLKIKPHFLPLGT